MKLLSSPMFSLFCAGFNTFFAIGSFMQGSLVLGVVCTIFAGLCFRNFFNSIKGDV